MPYRIARAIAESFKLIAFGGFVAMFFVAFTFVFILPIVPLFLIIAAPFVLVVSWIASDILSAVEQALARAGIRRGRCAACGADLVAERSGEQVTHGCSGCGRVFDADGDIWRASPDAATAAAGTPSAGKDERAEWAAQ